MAWEDELSDGLSYLTVTAWRAAIVGGGIAVAVGLVMGELPLILSGSLIAATGAAVSAVSTFAKRDDCEGMPTEVEFSTTDWELAPEPMVGRETGTGQFQDRLNRQKAVQRNRTR